MSSPVRKAPKPSPPTVAFPPSSPYSVAARFLETAEHFPDRPALVLPGRPPVSYAALAGRVDAVRQLLLSEGIQQDSVVGVAMEDPADWVPVLLAVLAEGAVYLVLDPRIPEARQRAQLEDSAAGWTLCSSETEGLIAALAVAGMRVVRASTVTDSGVRRPAVPRTAESVAFLTYTSGSTGTPKGVAIRHANILHEVAVHVSTLGLSPEDCLTGLYPPSTVGCTRDLYAALLCGASVSFFPFRDLGFAALKCWIRDQRITRYHSVPPIFRELAQEFGPDETLPHVRTVYLAGDRVAWSDLDLVRKHTGPGCRFYTGIGTSETSSLYAHGFVEPDEPREGPILPSGTAVPGVTLSLLNASGNPAAPGEPGEIVVTGCWLSAGYWRRDLRAPQPFPEADGSGNARVYRTGDHATLDRQGRLLFQGRRDQQTKILGNRIDLSEVDLHLRRLPGVREVAVQLLGGDGDTAPAQLTAFVSWGKTALPLSEVRKQLLQLLPVPAVPTRFHWLPAFPRLANGKLDSRELERIAATEPPVAEMAPPESGGAAATPAQQRMAQLWRDSLGVSEFGVHDSFFALGGHSLTAMKLLARIRTVFPGPVTMRMLFDAPTVAGLLDRMGNPEGTGSFPTEQSLRAPFEGPGLVPTLPCDTPPLASHAQERLWFLDALEPYSTAYIMPDAVLFRGSLDAGALERALHAIVKRHQSLRTVFSENEGVLFQVVQPIPDTVLGVEDLSQCPPTEQQARVEAARSLVLARPFSLSEGPLYRFQLLQLGDDRHLFLRAFHHIIADGWSVGVFHRELATAYSAAVMGKIPRFPELQVHYADLSAWQRQRLEGPRLRELLSHWIRQLEDAPPRLELPRDASRSCGPALALNLVRVLPLPLSEAVIRRSQSLGATPFMVLLATFQTLLGRLSGEEDVVVGTPTAGRSLQQAEPLIGYFVSTIALRTRLSGNPSFRELVQRVRDTVLDAQEHEELPFEKLIAELRTDRHSRHHPVFQVLFNLIGFEDTGATLPGLESSPEPVPPTHPKFDLTLYVIAQPGSFLLKARYASDLFLESSVARMLGQFEALLTEFAANPELPIGQPSLVLPEHHTVLPSAGAVLEEPKIRQPAIHAAFGEQAQLNPLRLAIREQGRDWTYRDLDIAARRISLALDSLGLERGAVVGVVAVPCGDLVAALIGVLRAGARFLVLDAAQPPGPLRRRLALSQPKALLVLDAAGDANGWREPSHLGWLNRPVLQVPSRLSEPSGPPCDRDAPPPSGEDPAYLVFTSGSTGEPLGILGDHGPVSHFLEWQRTRFDFTHGDRFSLLSGLGHDPLLRDVFAPLSIGASLHIPPPGIRESPGALEVWFHAEGISVTHITPPLAGVLSEVRPAPARTLTSLRWIFLGGDRLTGALVSMLGERAPHAGMVNCYGTTETPQIMAFHEVVRPGPGLPDRARVRDPIPVGKPIPGVQLQIRNAAGRPAGIGEPGEILVRTRYLSSGYLEAPERQMHSFVANPVTGDAEDRIYRTGDLGYFLADGSVVFLRRTDQQIKLRGYRIEPDEVRAALRELPSVRDAAVVLDAQLGALHAYLVLCTPLEPPSRQTIRNGLRGVLPEVAIPARFFVVASLPLTGNGKLDLRSLVHRTFPELHGEDRILSPRTPMERAIHHVWQEVLGQPSVGIQDNFFDLGGHSLLALRLVIALRERLRFDASLADLMAHPSVGALAGLLMQRTRGEPPPDTPTPTIRGFRGSPSGVPWIHVPGVMGFEFLPPDLADVIGRYRPYHDGLQFPGLNEHTKPESTIAGIAAALIAQVEALCPHGPLWLSGYSMGGMVAHEMARQLTDRGRPVERVVLFDVRYIRDARRNPVRVRLRRIAEHLADRSWRERVQWALHLISAKLRRRRRLRLLLQGRGDASATDRLEAAGWTALTSHVPQPYHGRVTLLRATRLGEHDTARLERDRWNGWGPWGHPGFEIIDLDCDHRSIFLEPVARASVAALESLLAPILASKSGLS